MFQHLFNKSGYIYTNKTNPKWGIMSSVLGFISLVSIGLAVFLAYRNSGAAPMQYGSVAALSMLYAGTGLILGVRSLMKPDIFRFFPAVGIVFNVLAMIACSFILYLGVAGV